MVMFSFTISSICNGLRPTSQRTDQLEAAVLEGVVVDNKKTGKVLNQS